MAPALTARVPRAIYTFTATLFDPFVSLARRKLFRKTLRPETGISHLRTQPPIDVLDRLRRPDAAKTRADTNRIFIIAKRGLHAGGLCQSILFRAAVRVHSALVSRFQL